MGISAAGSRLKSLQRGVISLTGVTSNTATISAVNTAKAEVRFIGIWCDTAVTVPAATQTKLDLTNGTTVTATRANAGGNVTINYEVSEWE